jgi:sirohydrochlorin cobaltochelatase
MKTPILITAVGTTEKAFKTYGYIDKFFRAKFKDNPIRWAYSSRFVKAKENNHDIKGPVEILRELKNDGNKVVLVQPLHIIAGYEFHQVILEALKLDISISIGLPLLSSVKDYEETVRAVASLIPKSEDEAAVFVGHGTDHPSWTSYPVFEEFLRRKWGSRVFTGVLKGYPDMDEILIIQDL